MRERAAENDAPPAGEFCHRHWSWLCQAGQGKCGDGVPTTRLRVNVNDDCAEHLEAMRDDVHDLNPYRAAQPTEGES